MHSVVFAPIILNFIAPSTITPKEIQKQTKVHLLSCITLTECESKVHYTVFLTSTSLLHLALIVNLSWLVIRVQTSIQMYPKRICYKNRCNFC